MRYLTKRKTIMITVLLIISLLAWAPWITEEYAKNKFMLDSCFIQSHGPGSGQENPEIHVNWYPFGRWVTTYDCGQFVTFYSNVIP
jgi:hypothetical protein